LKILVATNTPRVYCFVAMIKTKAILALEKAVDVKYEADKAAIRHVLKLCRQHGISPTGGQSRRSETDTHPVAQGAPNGDGVETQIRAAILKQTGQFGLQDLTKILPDVKRSTISGVLYRESGKTVKVIIKGQGRRLGVYEKM
jgi:hypothetical protein